MIYTVGYWKDRLESELQYSHICSLYSVSVSMYTVGVKRLKAAVKSRACRPMGRAPAGNSDETFGAGWRLPGRSPQSYSCRDWAPRTGTAVRRVTPFFQLQSSVSATIDRGGITPRPWFCAFLSPGGCELAAPPLVRGRSSSPRVGWRCSWLAGWLERPQWHVVRSPQYHMFFLENLYILFTERVVVVHMIPTTHCWIFSETELIVWCVSTGAVSYRCVTRLENLVSSSRICDCNCRPQKYTFVGYKMRYGLAM